MRARTIGMVLIVAIACALIAWRCSRRSDGPPPRPTTIRSGKLVLDVQAFERLRNARIDRAKRPAATRAKASGPPSTYRADFAGTECWLGPAELCDILVDLLDDCDAGDATTCFAIGQFLADTPPRALIAVMFVVKACNAGDQDACVYRDRVQPDAPPVSCDEDPLGCGWRSMRTRDPAALDDACMHGVADSCATAGIDLERGGDLERSQAYLEQACQLGSPVVCQVLAHRLSADCEPQPITDVDDEIVYWTPCYAIDEVEAAKARDIGCGAGWGTGCRYEPP